MNETKVNDVIFSELKKLHSRSYFDRAPQGTIFPFVVFNTLPCFQQEGTKEEFMLEVNIWSNTGNNITELLQITKLIQDLHKTIYIDEYMMLEYNRESTIPLKDAEEQIRRRQITFAVKYYSREG